MEKSVFVQARDLPPEKRHAAEVLLCGALSEDELVLIRSSKGRILKPGLAGDALSEAYRQSFDWSAEMSKRVEGVPASELGPAIDESSRLRATAARFSIDTAILIGGNVSATGPAKELLLKAIPDWHCPMKVSTPWVTWRFPDTLLPTPRPSSGLSEGFAMQGISRDGSV